jgi:hypothetical protein
LVERRLPKPKVASSNLVSRSGQIHQDAGATVIEHPPAAMPRRCRQEPGQYATGDPALEVLVTVAFPSLTVQTIVHVLPAP